MSEVNEDERQARLAAIQARAAELSQVQLKACQFPNCNQASDGYATRYGMELCNGHRKTMLHGEQVMINANPVPWQEPTSD